MIAGYYIAVKTTPKLEKIPLNRILWSYICNPPRLEGIKEIGAARAGVDARDCSEPYPVDPPGIVVHTRQACLLRPIDPEDERTVVSARRCGCHPVQFDEVRRIADREPPAGLPGRAIIHQPGAQLVIAARVAKLHPQHHRRHPTVAVKNVMSIAAGHLDAVRVEVEPRPVAHLSEGTVVRHVDGIVVIDQRLHPVTTY